MNGLIMDYQLTLTAILRRAEMLYGHKQIVSRLPDKSLHRHAYADFVRRTKQLAVALRRLGVQRGERVATLCWNTSQHLEAYFGVPAAGAVLHTLNLRLHPDDLIYIANHAGDRVLLVDRTLLPLLEKFRERLTVEHVIVVGEGGPVPDGMLDYEQLLATVDPADYEELDIDENEAVAMCYTSGTTGRPKGVVYSHRALVLHSMALCAVDVLGVCERDVVLPVVPMFHANAWGIPFACVLAGASQVFPGPHLDPASLLELLQNERVTVTAGVPTIWLGILQLLDRQPGAYQLSQVRAMVVGGSAAPRSMIEGFQERHNLHVLHAWGMTELAPVGTVARVPGDMSDASPAEHYSYRAKQGAPLPLLEIRARGAEGIVPWDDATMGELEVRGPWVASSYYDTPGSDDRFTEDGWFRTGDIVKISPRGDVDIQDRTKDLIKSGGEWISSIALENALMSHPAVAEAAVIAIPDARWLERPLAVVVLKASETATAEELLDYLRPQFAKWWLPDAIEFVDAIPRTAVGKFLKSALRARFEGYRPTTQPANSLDQVSS